MAMYKMNKHDSFPCVGFEMHDSRQAYQHMDYEVVEHYGDECNGKYLFVFDEGKRYLAKCKNCGGLILVQKSELHGFEDEDAYYTDFFPVSSSQEAKEWNAYDGFEIESKFKKRYLMYTDGNISWSK